MKRAHWSRQQSSCCSPHQTLYRPRGSASAHLETSSSFYCAIATASSEDGKGIGVCVSGFGDRVTSRTTLFSKKSPRTQLVGPRTLCYSPVQVLPHSRRSDEPGQTGDEGGRRDVGDAFVHFLLARCRHCPQRSRLFGLLRRRHCRTSGRTGGAYTRSWRVCGTSFFGRPLV